MDLNFLKLQNLYFLDDLDLHVIENHDDLDRLSRDQLRMMEKNGIEY